MKKLLCVVPALLLFAMISAPNARADSYTPTLICGNLPGNGGCFPFPVASDETVSFPAPILSVSTAPFAPSPINVQLPAADSPMDTYTWNLEAINIPPVPYENFAEQPDNLRPDDPSHVCGIDHRSGILNNWRW
jgi:hypothetical protein